MVRVCLLVVSGLELFESGVRDCSELSTLGTITKHFALAVHVAVLFHHSDLHQQQGMATNVVHVEIVSFRYSSCVWCYSQ